MTRHRARGRIQPALTLIVCITATVWCLPRSVARVSAGAAQKGARARRVLFIGNSYTYYNNMPRMLQAMAEAGDPSSPLDTQMAVAPFAILRQHWHGGPWYSVPAANGSPAFDQAPDVAARTRLANEQWDAVVLQEQSALGLPLPENGYPAMAGPDDPASFFESVRFWDREIARHGAKTVLYMTWARQDRPQDQADLAAAYERIAGERGALLAPVGLAWQEARRRRPSYVFHREDLSHPTPAGSYLTACVFYSIFSGRSPEGLPGRIAGRRLLERDGRFSGQEGNLVSLSPDDARFLQRAAWDTVRSVPQFGQ